MAIPTAFVRKGDKLYIHGSVGSHFIRTIEQGNPVCISVMLTDGLVLAKSAFHHSVNYRSVVIFTNAEKVTDETERMDALALIDENLPTWAGVIPMKTVRLTPVPAENSLTTELPDYLQRT